MTLEQILYNESLMKRFCRDYSVPVSTLKYPYIERQLNTLSLHDSSYLNRFNDFIREVADYKNEEEYFAYYNGIKESIINYICNHPQYKSFIEKSFRKNSFEKKELYSETNHKKVFVSIDLRKANFTIMKLHCPEMFGDKSWEQTVESFGGSHYLQNSKYIRQVIFGACNPKKQIQAQTELMCDLANYLVEHGVKIYSVATDEILVEDTEFFDIYNMVSNYTGVPHDMSNILKIERFVLIHTDLGYVKNILGSTVSDDVGKYVFKCVDSDLCCQFVKYFYGAPIEEHDLLFDYKGSIAKFVKPIDNPWRNYKEDLNIII